MKDKSIRTLTIILVILLVLLAAVIGIGLFLRAYVVVGFRAYPRNAVALDLRGTGISVKHYEALREKLPNCKITWEVPFQGTYYPEDTTELTLTEISDEEIRTLKYLANLETVHAEDCEDYAQLAKLQETCPECEVLYTVSIGGKAYAQDTTRMTVTSLTDEEVALMDYLPKLRRVNAKKCSDFAQLAALKENHPDCVVDTFAGDVLGEDTTKLTITDGDTALVAELIAYLPKLKKLCLVDPVGEAEVLLQLVEDNPKLDVSWEMDVLGVTVTSEDTEVDLSGIAMETVDAVEDAMAFFPDVETVIMSDCGIDNETMAEFREDKREEYKVVWSVMCGKIKVRTDETTFMPVRENVYYFHDEDVYNLRYCEDMLCVDLGHMTFTDLEWATYMPHLKYLVLAHTTVLDISALSSCKELVFLELDWTGIKDYSPLVECTALEDLNLGLTYGDPEPIAQMTWLKNLWWKGRGGSVATMLQEALPDTNLMFNPSYTVGGGWRKLQNYYDMRDLLGMEYME